MDPPNRNPIPPNLPPSSLGFDEAAAAAAVSLLSLHLGLRLSLSLSHTHTRARAHTHMAASASTPQGVAERRGIPAAAFVEDVEAYLRQAGLDVNSALAFLQER